ncbi:MAG TPA: HD domain-containing phosphohydrolase [Vicinamibacterales bacterium]|nr:HD domain-containing phosphohydrolase [Vicinamibacterales bacterium]
MARDSARAAYLWLVIATGLVALADAVASAQWSPLDARWPILAGLTLLGAVATLRMRAAPVSFSISDTFTFTTLLLLGAAPATITAAFEALAISCFLSPGQRSLRRILFNVGAVGLAMWVAGALLTAIGGNQGQGVTDPSLARLGIAMAAAVATYFLVNTWLIALAVSFEQGEPPLATWRRHFLHLALNYFAGGYAALLLVVFAPARGLAGFVLLAPMPLVLYMALRIWIGRINDRVTHLDTINRQYRATIEALAHAVDAKDQVTHGHIRRVQTACLRLARALGCNDEAELHALEAASLLHDLGKLAVPEHILNKPGRLTEAEYARMKEHAAIGADIIAGIEFPFPVAPIVRHHHEAWDGSGYPDGLAGGQIPRGARILAVVDCFDALTSERPYRPAMSSTEALAILRARRGTMYDPAVVDAFVAQAPCIEPPAHPAPRGAAAPGVPEESWIESSEWPAFAAIGGPVLMVACRLTRAASGVVFAYVEAQDALAPAAAVGLDPALLPRLHMRLGERVSGWVAATGRIQTEADARLDLPGLETETRTAVSLPIRRGQLLVGVITLYGGPEELADAPVETLQVLASTLALAGLDQAARPPLSSLRTPA